MMVVGSLPEAWGNMTQLKSLSLSKNSLSGEAHTFKDPSCIRLLILFGDLCFLEKDGCGLACQPSTC
jgi:hypothetical protein